MSAVEDTLEAVFRMQKEFVSMMKQNRLPTTKEERISHLCTAIIHEAVELQRLTNWKWWKTPVKFDEARAREELIDIWHFVVHTSIELGMEPSDILHEYERKNLVNRERQINGY
jgi:dimeric dUTPase (all-alpha-NTP-PPase superfamily)